MDTDLGGATPDLAFGNDMVMTDNPALVAGQRAKAFSFNGTSQFLSRTHEISPENDRMPIYLSPAAYTISLWVKGLPQAASRSFFCMGNNANNTPLAWIETDPTANGDKLGFFLRTTSGTTIINHTKSTSVVLDDAWHHIAWVDNQGSVALYVDGVRDGANFNYAPAAAGSFLLNYTTIGALARGTAANYFAGAIDEVALWERPLTPEEVEQVRTDGISTPIPAAAPQFLQPLADSTRRLGDRAVFTVAAVGSHPLTYEWSRDGVAVPGQTGNTLTLTDLTTAGTTQIKVDVSNPQGTTSDSASLIVTDDPAPDVRSGVISHWPMDEVGGVVTPDRYSHNDMALVNMDLTNLMPGRFIEALTFDGVEECGNRIEGYPIYDNRTYSISLWVNGAPQNNRGVLGEGSVATSTPLIAFLTESTGFLDNLVLDGDSADPRPWHSGACGSAAAGGFSGAGGPDRRRLCGRHCELFGARQRHQAAAISVAQGRLPHCASQQSQCCDRRPDARERSDRGFGRLFGGHQQCGWIPHQPGGAVVGRGPLHPGDLGRCPQAGLWSDRFA